MPASTHEAVSVYGVGGSVASARPQGRVDAQALPLERGAGGSEALGLDAPFALQPRGGVLGPLAWPPSVLGVWGLSSSLCPSAWARVPPARLLPSSRRERSTLQKPGHWGGRQWEG